MGRERVHVMEALGQTYPLRKGSKTGRLTIYAVRRNGDIFLRLYTLYRKSAFIFVGETFGDAVCYSDVTIQI